MNKPYKIVMSRGDNIQIDSDELSKVLQGIQSGQPVVIRKGIFNPSFYVSIVKDGERWREFLEDIKYEENKEDLKLIGCEQLKDIFKDTVLRLEK